MDHDGDFVSWLGCRMSYVFIAKLERLGCIAGLSGCLADVKKGKWTLFWINISHLKHCLKFHCEQTQSNIPLGREFIWETTSPWAYVMEGKAFWFLRSAFFLCWLVVPWTELAKWLLQHNQQGCFLICEIGGGAHTHYIPAALPLLLV